MLPIRASLLGALAAFVLHPVQISSLRQAEELDHESEEEERPRGSGSTGSTGSKSNLSVPLLAGQPQERPFLDIEVRQALYPQALQALEAFSPQAQQALEALSPQGLQALASSPQVQQAVGQCQREGVFEEDGDRFFMDLEGQQGAVLSDEEQQQAAAGDASRPRTRWQAATERVIQCMCRYRRRPVPVAEKPEPPQPEPTMPTKFWMGASMCDIGENDDCKPGQTGFKEDELPEWRHFDDRKRMFSSGIAFSGGGIRSSIPTIAALKVLLSTGVYEFVRYAVALSGGSWGLVSFIFGNAHSGPEVVHPSQWSDLFVRDASKATAKHWKDLTFDTDTLHGGLLLAMTQMSKLKSAASAFQRNLTKSEFESAWMQWVSDHIFQPSGIDPFTVLHSPDRWDAGVFITHLLAYNAGGNHEHIQAGLTNDAYKLTDPVPIITAALLGPKGFDAPYPQYDRMYSGVEFTPYWSGIWTADDARSRHFAGTKPRDIVIGGFIESAMFGADSPTDAIEAPRGSPVRKDVQMPCPWRLLDACGVSSYAPGAAFYQSKVRRLFPVHVANYIGFDTPERTEASRLKAAPYSEEMVVSDGGNVANLPVMPLLQRRIKCVVAMMNSEWSLNIDWAMGAVADFRARGVDGLDCVLKPPHSPGAEKDITDDPRCPKRRHIDCDLAALFGLRITELRQVEASGLYPRNNQVFRPADFYHMLEDMLNSHADGGHLTSSRRMNVLENEHWGIKPYEAQVTIMYNSPSEAWKRAAERYLQTEAHGKGADTAAAGTFATFEEDFRTRWGGQKPSPHRQWPIADTIAMTFNAWAPLEVWLHYQNAGFQMLQTLEGHGPDSHPLLGKFCLAEGHDEATRQDIAHLATDQARAAADKNDHARKRADPALAAKASSSSGSAPKASSSARAGVSPKASAASSRANDPPKGGNTDKASSSAGSRPASPSRSARPQK